MFELPCNWFQEKLPWCSWTKFHVFPNVLVLLFISGHNTFLIKWRPWESLYMMSIFNCPDNVISPMHGKCFIFYPPHIIIRNTARFPIMWNVAVRQMHLNYTITFYGLSQKRMLSAKCLTKLGNNFLIRKARIAKFQDNNFWFDD